MSNSNPNVQNFQQYLQSELIRRCQKNPKYSLRSFAKNLGVTPSLLSRVLNGKRTITTSFISKTAASLNLSPQDLQKYIAPVAPAKAAMNIQNQAERVPFQTLAVEHLAAISDWVHHALFELMDTNPRTDDLKWLAKRLGVSAYEVEAARERLEKIGLIRKNKKGLYEKTQPGFATTGHAFSLVAFRQLQKQFLQKAIQAMDEVPMDLRDQTTMTMAVDSSQLARAKEKIKKFRYEMHDLLRETQNLDQVYALTIGFYPLTQNLKTKKGDKKNEK